MDYLSCIKNPLSRKKQPASAVMGERRYHEAMGRFRRLALQSGVCLPFLYFGTVIVASLFVPGYSHVRQAASELGMAGVPHPQGPKNRMFALQVNHGFREGPADEDRSWDACNGVSFHSA
jgi:hypothetical protein